MPTSSSHWLKGTFPEWLVVGLTGIVAWFAVQYLQDQKEFRKEANARLIMIERQTAVLDARLAILESRMPARP